MVSRYPNKYASPLPGGYLDSQQYVQLWASLSEVTLLDAATKAKTLSRLAVQNHMVHVQIACIVNPTDRDPVLTGYHSASGVFCTFINSFM